MTDARCPYLTRERTAWRQSLDLSLPAPMNVVVTWYCEHPFHGVRIELGEGSAAVDLRCSSCALPREEAAQPR